jgi:hypothetical protein
MTTTTETPAALLRDAAKLRALTVRQPWAGCIAHLDKRVENRTWKCPPRFVGTRVAIHASAAVDDCEFLSVPDGDAFASLFASSAEWDAWRFWWMDRKKRDVANWPPKLALGAVVAVATITACHYDQDPECHGDPRTAGCLCSVWARVCQFHWQLADVHSLAEPVPARGMLGLWTVPDEAERAVTAQLGEQACPA